MNINGPWCFVQNGDIISMEACDVCQSLGKLRIGWKNLFKIIFILAPRPTLPTDIGAIDDVTIVAVNNGFFENFRDEMQRYGAYLRQRFMEIINRMREKMRKIRARISDHFNFNG